MISAAPQQMTSAMYGQHACLLTCQHKRPSDPSGAYGAPDGPHGMIWVSLLEWYSPQLQEFETKNCYSS